MVCMIINICHEHNFSLLLILYAFNILFVAIIKAEFSHCTTKKVSEHCSRIKFETSRNLLLVLKMITCTARYRCKADHAGDSSDLKPTHF